MTVRVRMRTFNTEISPMVAVNRLKYVEKARYFNYNHLEVTVWLEINYHRLFYSILFLSLYTLKSASRNFTINNTWSIVCDRGSIVLSRLI